MVRWAFRRSAIARLVRASYLTKHLRGGMKSRTNSMARTRARSIQQGGRQAFSNARAGLFALCVFCLVVARPLRAQLPSPSATPEEIKPPFGLQWGESSDRLDKLLKGAKAQIVEKHTVEGREAWTVEGLLQTGLKRTLFYFRDGQLVEVELQYQSPDWDTAKYDDFMAQVRRRIEQRFGAGQLIARSKAPEGDVTQTIVGYKWNLNNTAIQLFYYAAETAKDSYRTVSVHYKVL